MIELLTNAEMAQADKFAIAGGVAGTTLMENAGRALAERVGQRFSSQAKVVVLAGPGNNGGDGFVAARLLAERGHAVRVLLTGDKDKVKGDAAEAAARWFGSTEPADAAALAGAHLIIDALFGAGLDRPVEGVARAMIEAMNIAGAPIVAVDLPSGINGSSGAVMGAAVRASETVTFFRQKPGHILLPGRMHCGTVHVADIGIPASVLERIKPRLCLNVPQLWAEFFPLPRPDTHKHARGHAVVMSGPPASTGAARLAARGALRAGAGLVTIGSPPDALAVNAAANVAVMVRPIDGAAALSAFLADRRRNAIVLGPGGGVGATMRELVTAALATEAAVVLDADALTSFADAPARLLDLTRARGSAATVLTPHEGEFMRLFNDTSQVSNKTAKYDRAIAAAQASNAIFVLKGSDTVVAAPDGRAAIAENAPPWLATAGSGDVLAGFVAALLAQHMPGFAAAAAAVWVHGECGREVGPGLIAEDLPEAIPRVYRRLFADLAERP